MRPFLTLLCCFPLALTAQHCGYDFASIIVVRPHVEGDTQVVKGLRITLLDSMNLPVTIGGEAWHLFRPNTDLKACQRYQHGFARGYAVCFPFAKDNYVLVLPRGMDTAKLKELVQDDRLPVDVDYHRRNWIYPFAMQVVPLMAFDSYPLCGTYNDEDYPDMLDRPSFHPVDITLRSR
ncbi:MAG TPA: hypothetical protein PKY96_07875 [Flavobacteriales bacterium]|nr:hypothetical protein [Flavobacteriales bacterium]